MTESTPGTTPTPRSDRAQESPNEAQISETTIAEAETSSGDTTSPDARIENADSADDDLDALATPAEKATPISKVRRWLTIAIAVVFGLLFAYQVWGGVGSAITIPRRVSEAGGSVSALGWTMLILSIIVPLITFYLSYRIGRRRGWISMILTYLVGVAASSAIALSLAAAFFLA